MMPLRSRIILNQYKKKDAVESQNNVSEKPIVSAIVVTYQHANYIHRCLNGILMQRTDFDVEILLGDDESNDGTREICIDYAQKYPDIIRLFLHSRNNNIRINNQPTGRYNLLYNLAQAKGKYIAICEGDDFWTDPFKLQKQVAFLEENKEFSICFHNAKITWENNHKDNVSLFHEFSWSKLNIKKDEYSIEDTFRGALMHTATVVFCAESLPNPIPKWFKRVQSGDLVLFSLITRDKRIKYLNETMSVYRKHDSSITQNHTGIGFQINRIYMLYMLNTYYKGKYEISIQAVITEYLENIRNYILHSGNVVKYKEIVTISRIKIVSKIIDDTSYRIMFKSYIDSCWLKRIINPILRIRRYIIE